jgi:hypothetical protein
MGTQVKIALLVEPQFIHGLTATEMLNDAGFQVEERMSAAEAAHLLNEHPNQYNIAVVKFPYEEDEGLRTETVELLDKLRELRLPRVVVSVLNRDELTKVYPLKKGEGYLGVPFRGDALKRVVEETLQEG